MPGCPGTQYHQKSEKRKITKACPSVPLKAKNVEFSGSAWVGHSYGRVCPTCVPCPTPVPGAELHQKAKNVVFTRHIKNCCKPSINVLQFWKTRKKGG